MAQRTSKAKKASTNSKPGRPTDFTATLGNAICERIADGESLRSICRTAGMPDKSTVFRWLAGNSEFCDQYARAREAQADHMADEIVEISDEAAYEDIKVEGGKVVGVKFDATAVARNKLRVDARKWVAAKLKPRVYGNAVTVKGDPNNPLQVRRAADLTDDELAALAAAGAANG